MCRCCMYRLSTGQGSINIKLALSFNYYYKLAFVLQIKKKGIHSFPMTMLTQYKSFDNDSFSKARMFFLITKEKYKNKKSKFTYYGIYVV